MKRVLIIITLSLVLLSCTKRESSVLDSRPRVGAGITFTLSDTKGNDLLDSTSLHFIDLANVRVWAVDKSGNKFEVTNTAQRNDTIYFGQTLKTKEFILGGINGHKFVLSTQLTRVHFNNRNIPSTTIIEWDKNNSDTLVVVFDEDYNLNAKSITLNSKLIWDHSGGERNFDKVLIGR